MIKNYLKIAWRNIIRHKTYSAINVVGLTIGIAACLLIFLIIQFELSYDTFQPNYKNIYHIATEQMSESGIDYNPGVGIPATEALRLEFPKAKVASINSSYGSQITVADGDDLKYTGGKKFTENVGVVFIEPQFFDIFSWRWLAGNATVLANPNMVVLDQSTASKYFGSWTNAVGKSIKMDNLINLKVAGVIEDAPSNSDFPFKVLVSHITWKNYPKDYNYSTDWGLLSSNHQVFMLFPDHTGLQDIDAQLKRVTIKYYKSGLKHHLIVAQPLSLMHFDTIFGNTLGDHITTKATLRTLFFIAILIIVMASINFINLSTAQSVGRSKEVGIRKVLGSSRKQLAVQVIGETAFIVIGATLLAILVGKLSMPYLKNIASVPDDINLLNGGSVIFLALTAIVVIILSGIYPALIVSGFKPVLALKNKITAASIGGISLRRTLVITQFAISQLLIIGTVVAVSQMDFVNKADLGFNKNAVLMLPGYTDSISLKKMQSFKQQVLQNPAVQSVSFNSDAPSSDNNSAENFNFNHSAKDPGFPTFVKIGDADYFKTFGLRFTAGKGYEVSDTMRQAVVNQTLLRKLGVLHDEDAVGKTISLGGGSWATITGVVEDFKTNSLREAVKPIVIYPLKKYESQAAVKIKSNNLVKTVTGIQSLWEKTYPEYAYNGFFLNESIAKFYKQENQLALVYKIFAFIAIFISCLGLYGLVSFMAVQRTKEVGVRKVLGASVSSIVLLFSKEFVVLIIISCVIAMPAAYYIMTGWLQNFAYRISLNIWVFVLSVIISVVIAWLTVSYKAIKAATVNPVKSLRSE
ncbi:ABC transporter permease [Mucilaginibacter sp. X4EP1]|uniref:ABC transporter permease n=1 Tax=Mucilaginibacter sp. X4EP1 TaxID=2723092 RepID=UPI002169F468|nr:ABC transporter permease [Mucilaginibacter sp. X4EP1]MCS3813242.1 putative permease [Mucilaginibacter sp. X4EP1]